MGSIPQASDNGGAWGFSRKDAARVGRTVRRVEAQLYNSAPARAKYPVGPSSAALVPLSITSNVAAGTEAAPSPFNATVLVPSGTTNGWTATGGAAITAYNRAPGIAFSASAGSPKSAWGVSEQGIVYLLSADC